MCLEKYFILCKRITFSFLTLIVFPCSLSSICFNNLSLGHFNLCVLRKIPSFYTELLGVVYLAKHDYSLLSGCCLPRKAGLLPALINVWKKKDKIFLTHFLFIYYLEFNPLFTSLIQYKYTFNFYIYKMFY